MRPGTARGPNPAIVSGYRWRLALATWLLTAAGCGAESKVESTSAVLATAEVAPPAAASAADRSAPAQGATNAAAVPPAIPRKIIYNARVNLLVESVTALGDQVTRLVTDAGGYVSQTDQTSAAHSQQGATWTVRVPVERFDTFLTAVGRLGEVLQRHVDSQDVTQEFYDIEARITNKQQEEKRLLKHLDDSTGKLEDILNVEREVSRVRGEIESMQGRIRYLSSFATLSTVTITASEVQNYVPPVQPTFGAQISRTFAHSVEVLVDFGKAITLAAVAIAPWIPVVLLVALPFLIAWRRRRADRRPDVAFVTPGPRPS